MDLHLQSTNKLEDIKLILQSLNREVNTLGEFMGGALYKVDYYQEKIESAEIREWINQLSALRREIDSAIGVINE